MKYALFTIALLIVIALSLELPNEKVIVETDPLKANFDSINENRNSACYGISTVMQMPDDGYIMGSCCGPMYLHRYEEQIEALKAYENIKEIPKDPYNVSVFDAKRMISYFKDIQLSSEQQAIYEEAKKLSQEGGPCCCGDDFSETTCWRWKVYGGLAKYMITKYNYNAKQVAELWDISDGCGGDSHVEEGHAIS